MLWQKSAWVCLCLPLSLQRSSPEDRLNQRIWPSNPTSTLYSPLLVRAFNAFLSLQQAICTKDQTAETKQWCSFCWFMTFGTKACPIFSVFRTLQHISLPYNSLQKCTVIWSTSLWSIHIGLGSLLKFPTSSVFCNGFVKMVFQSPLPEPLPDRQMRFLLFDQVPSDTIHKLKSAKYVSMGPQSHNLNAMVVEIADIHLGNHHYVRSLIFWSCFAH